MDIRSIDTVVSGVLIGLGVYLVWSGFGYGIMRGTTPGPGLFPALIGAVMAVLSAVNLARSVAGRENLDEGMARAEVARVAALVAVLAGVIVLSELIGITLASVLMVVAASLIIRREVDGVQAVKIVVVALAIPFLCRWLFRDVLSVPIPTGPLGL